MRRGVAIAMLAGLLLAGLLVAHQGLPGMGRAVAGIGWGIVLVVTIHLLQVALSGMAWRAPLSRHPAAPSLPFFIQARWIREAVSGLLPMTQIGGEFVGVRLLALRGMAGGTAGASVVIDLTMEVVSQFLFTLLGLVVLLLSGRSGEVVRWAVAGLLLMAPAILGFLLAQRYGLFRAVERFCDWIAGHSGLLNTGVAGGLHQAILDLYRRPRALFQSCNLHLLSWVIGTLEVWLILHLLGAPVTLVQALVLESLGQAVRSAAFFIPGGLGVQEGGFLLLGTLFGLPPETGLALSLVKRVREVILGLPGLLAWQLVEGRRLWTARPAPVPDRTGD